MKSYDSIIIGSGPAGYTAAIYLARYSISHILFTGDIKGGQLTTTNKIYNYPGFSNGVYGMKLMDEMYNQAVKFGSIIKEDTITKIIINKYRKGLINYHLLYTKYGKRLITKTIIIATGSLPKRINIKNENKFIGRGISYCATCDGILFKNKVIAIIGGGDTALEESLYLSKICKKIYLIVRKPKVKAVLYLQNKILNIEKIKILYNSTVTKLLGKNNLSKIKINNSKKNKTRYIKISGLFIAIGNIPNTSIINKQIKVDSSGYIVTENKSTTTSIKSVFAAGDVQDPKYKQAITAAGTGCMAAINVDQYLSKYINNE